MEVKNENGRKGCSFRRRSGVQWQGVFWYKCNKIDTFQIYQWLPYKRQLICDFWSITLLKFLVKFPIISFTHHISFSATPNNNWCRKELFTTALLCAWCTEHFRGKSSALLISIFNIYTPIYINMQNSTRFWLIQGLCMVAD